MVVSVAIKSAHALNEYEMIGYGCLQKLSCTYDVIKQSCLPMTSRCEGFRLWIERVLQLSSLMLTLVDELYLSMK